MLRALFNALKNAIASLSQGLWWMVQLPFRILDGLLGGGGAAGTVMPKKNLALPNPDEIEVARAHARRDVEVAAKTASWSGPHQSRMFALEPSESRYRMSLDQLSTRQQEWLQALSETDLRVIADTDDGKLTKVLGGEDNILAGIDSVGCENRQHSGVLAGRIDRRRLSRPSELNHVLAA